MNKAISLVILWFSYPDRGFILLSHLRNGTSFGFGDCASSVGRQVWCDALIATRHRFYTQNRRAIRYSRTKKKPAHVQEINLNNYNNNSNNNNKKAASAAVAELTKSSELTKAAREWVGRWCWCWKHRRMEQCQCRANLWPAGEGRSRHTQNRFWLN